MRHLYTILAALLLCAAPLHAQVLKSLMYNTTNGQVVYSGTNALNFNTIQLNEFFFPGTSIFSMGIGTLQGGERFFRVTASNTITVRFRANQTEFIKPLEFNNTTNAATTRTNLGLGWPALTNTNAATSLLGYTTNGQVVANTETNVLTFTNALSFGTNPATVQATYQALGFNVGTEKGSPAARELYDAANGDTAFYMEDETVFIGGTFVAPFRASLGFSTNLNTLWTATNASNAQSAVGLGATNGVTFAGLTNNGDIRINQTATNNGLLFVFRTNNEPFLGLANLLASNNTTVSNETLFRVGVAEATNRSAQFGFRSTNTNGDGVAVFSVFGFNALMQIGADASTNAVIYSGGGTNNEVMTLIRDGATEFARPLRFSTNASTRPSTNAPANTTNVAAWVEVRIGTNAYRVPLYQ